MEKFTKWHGKYRGIRFEIYNWTWPSIRDCWTYYLILNLKQLPTKPKGTFDLKPREDSGLFKGHIFFPYGGSFWASLDWHGRITFYEKTWDEVGNLEGFKVGCNFQHYFDGEHRYTINQVEKECQETIDTLWEQLPEMKVWCLQDGSYHFPGKCPQGLDERELSG